MRRLGLNWNYSRKDTDCAVSQTLTQFSLRIENADEVILTPWATVYLGLLQVHWLRHRISRSGIIVPNDEIVCVVCNEIHKL